MSCPRCRFSLPVIAVLLWGAGPADAQPRFDHVASIGTSPPRGVLTPPDHRHVYLITTDRRLEIYARDAASGQLTFAEAVPHEAFLGPLAFSPDGRTLFALGRSGYDEPFGVLDRFERHPVTGRLRPRAAVGDARLLGTSSLVTSPDGRVLYAGLDSPFPGDLFEGAVTWVDLDSGAVAGSTSAGSEPPPPVHGLAITADGRRLLALVDESLNLSGPLRGGIVEYAAGAATGALTRRHEHLEPELHRARHMVLAAGGRYLYVATNGFLDGGSDRLLTLARDPATGSLTRIDGLASSTPGLAGLREPRALALTAGGELLLLGRRALNVFVRDASTGILSLAQVLELDAASDPVGMAIDPAGGRAYVADAGDNSLFVFNARCVPGEHTACLGDADRFRVGVDWRDFAGATGRGSLGPEGPNAALFTFFSPDNWEVLVKVLDGCGLNGRHWVFAAATTDVAYDLVVTDTASGTSRTYSNELGRASPAVTDTSAFAACDGLDPSDLEVVEHPVDRHPGH